MSKPELDPALANVTLDDALTRYALLQELLAKRNNTDSDRIQRLFDDPIAVSSGLLDSYVELPPIAEALQAELDGVRKDEEALRYLAESAGQIGVESAGLDAGRSELEARKQHPLFQLALKYYGATAVKSAKAAPKVPKGAVPARKPRPKPSRASAEAPNTRGENRERLAAQAFLSQGVFTVARALEGMKLKLGNEGQAFDILATREQDGSFNARYLTTRPIFGAERRDVYVGAVRGRYMVFIAAGDPAKADSCVTIMSVKTSEGAEFDKPTKVAYELGLKSEMVGNVRVRGKTLILDLEERKQ